MSHPPPQPATAPTVPASTAPALPASEFVALMAVVISLTALAIDAVLPALPRIASDLHVADQNTVQYVVTVMFAGFCVGQLVFGALSDGIGRKPSIYAGTAVFLLGCVVSLAAGSFVTMLLGRALQGFGASALRVVSTAVIRDQYAGRAMARIMALIMAVFILVPAVAPALGQVVMALFDWRAIFIMLLVHAAVALAWFAARQPETLASADRRHLGPRAIADGCLQVLRSRAALGYTLTSGLVFSGMIAYLTCAQQIFEDIYAVRDDFPLYFGGLALSIGVASVVNSRLVEAMGMLRLSYAALLTICGTSAVFSLVCLGTAGQPPLGAFVAFMLLVFAGIGLTFGNFTALAMEPLGHLAGLGAAVVGAGSTLVSLLLGGLIGQYYDGTLWPLTLGFLTLGAASLSLMAWTEHGRR